MVWKFLSIILIVIKSISNEDIPIYSCPLKRLVTVHIKQAVVPLYSPKSTCVLTGVHRTVTDRYFQVQPDDTIITEIEHVTFEESQMKVFTPDVCEALPYLTYINADRLGLISVEEDAFQQCSKLKIIDLTLNQLTELPPGLFRSNPVLRVVNIEHNKISEVDEAFFDRNKVLKDVFFGHNTFYQLPDKLFDKVPNIDIVGLRYNNFNRMPLMNSRVTNLTEIDLSYNHLHDVDIEGIHKKFPNLRKLDLKSNEFLCQRQRDIDREFRQRKQINSDLTGTCIETMELWSLKKEVRESKVKERILEAQIEREKAKKRPKTTVKPRYVPRIVPEPEEDEEEVDPSTTTELPTQTLINIILGSLVILLILILIIYFSWKKFHQPVTPVSSMNPMPSAPVTQMELVKLGSRYQRDRNLPDDDFSFSDGEETNYYDYVSKNQLYPVTPDGHYANHTLEPKYTQAPNPYDRLKFLKEVSL